MRAMRGLAAKVRPTIGDALELQVEGISQRRRRVNSKMRTALSWLSALESGTPFTLKAEDIEPFEYGGSVAVGGLSKGFLGGSSKSKTAALGPVIEEVAEADEESTKRANEGGLRN